MPLKTAFHSPHAATRRSIPPAGRAGSLRRPLVPVNASGAMTGVQTMWSGFGKSVNTYFVQLEQAVGADKAVRMAERLGLTVAHRRRPVMASPARSKGWGAFTLGVADTTPLEMANAYATVAADGIYCEPLPVLAITDADGTPAMLQGRWSRSPSRGATRRSRRTWPGPPPTRRSALTGVRRGAARAAVGPRRRACTATVGRPVGGKTGTTDNTRAAWFVGFTPELAAATSSPTRTTRSTRVGDGQSNKPIDSVAQTLRDALRGQPVRRFAPPSGAIIN